MRRLFARPRSWIFHWFDVIVIWFLGVGNVDLTGLRPATNFSGWESALRHDYFRSVLDFVIEQSIVGLLIVTHKLINILVNLHCWGRGARCVLELNVKFARFLGQSLNLNCIARSFEDLGRLARQFRRWVVVLTSLSCSLFSLVDIHIKVLPSRGIVIPISISLWLCLVFGSNFLLQSVDALLVLISLLLGICKLSFIGCCSTTRGGRPRDFLGRQWPLLSLLVFWIASTAALRVVAYHSDRSGLLTGKQSSVVYIHTESKLLLLKRHFLLWRHSYGSFLPVARLIKVVFLVLILLTISSYTVQVDIVAPKSITIQIIVSFRCKNHDALTLQCRGGRCFSIQLPHYDCWRHFSWQFHRTEDRCGSFTQLRSPVSSQIQKTYRF